MPGVHQRFVAMDGTVNMLDRNVASGFEKLGTKVDGLADLFTDLQANNQERDAKLADSLRTLAERLGTPANLLLLFRLQQDDNNKSNRQAVVATINLLHYATKQMKVLMKVKSEL
jgi:hypothetical protein